MIDLSKCLSDYEVRHYGFMSYAHDMTRNSTRGECEILPIAEEFLKRHFEYVVPTGLTFENFLGADFECINKLERVHFVDVKGCRNVDGSNIEIDVELVGELPMN